MASLRYMMETIIYSKIGTNNRKAMNDNAKRMNPFVLFLAYVIRNDATNINPMAIKDAHILSMDDTGITTPVYVDFRCSYHITKKA
ncbi:hypothetical protein PAESOLCIP111_01427 [Paenibacillus solanacearum]|uniref:Uncharacterized protein n=1 Tax=Paenibacillus solanacearum TaxID=2048548 RepID=A0A916JWW7_9BACL|nr:hypothetical protein PAESOLCIP111_01427 [Paenibacillus solanacearum]